MSRPIKFRTWVGTEMYYSSQAGLEEFFSNGFGEIMQYTGLKDKNGKEIYEGDIILLPNSAYEPSEGKNPNLVETVMFAIGCFKAGELPLFEYESNEMEIIGNIYENGDLLNETKKKD